MPARVRALCEVGWDNSMSLAGGFLWDGQVSQAAALSTLLQSCGEQLPSAVPRAVCGLGQPAQGGRVGGCWQRDTAVLQGMGRQPELLRTLQLSDLPWKPCPETNRLVPCSCCPSRNEGMCKSKAQRLGELSSGSWFLSEIDSFFQLS